jgi:hypothetical protein
LAIKEADRKRAVFRAANKNAEMPKEDEKVIAERRKLEGQSCEEDVAGQRSGTRIFCLAIQQ